MNQKYFLGIVTELTTGVLDYNGHVHHDTTVKWSKGYDNMRELLDAADEYLSVFELGANQRIVIEARPQQ